MLQRGFDRSCVVTVAARLVGCWPAWERSSPPSRLLLSAGWRGNSGEGPSTQSTQSIEARWSMQVWPGSMHQIHGNRVDQSHSSNSIDPSWHSSSNPSIQAAHVIHSMHSTSNALHCIPCTHSSIQFKSNAPNTPTGTGTETAASPKAPGTCDDTGSCYTKALRPSCPTLSVRSLPLLHAYSSGPCAAAAGTDAWSRSRCPPPRRQHAPPLWWVAYIYLCVYWVGSIKY